MLHKDDVKGRQALFSLEVPKSQIHFQHPLMTSIAVITTADPHVSQ